MNIFLDTNVFADAFLNRDDGSAKRALKFLEEQNIELFLNDISIINITYIIRKEFSKYEISKIIDELLLKHNIVSVNAKIIEDANHSKFKDFEDGVQYFSAREIDADLIISNNKKDFKMSDINVLTPKEFCLVYVD
jgi:predicted nucleic acid-binding protein